MTRFLLYKGYICQEKSFETDSLRSPSQFVYRCLLYSHIYTRRTPVTWILGGENWPSGMTGDQRRHVTVMHRGLELYTQIAIAIFKTKYSGLWTASLNMHTDYSSHIPSKKSVRTAAEAQRRNGNHWTFSRLHLGFLYICLVVEKRRAHSVSRP